MADRGLAGGGNINPKIDGANLIFWPISPENCMKMKKSGRGGGGGGGAPGTYLEPAVLTVKLLS